MIYPKPYVVLYMSDNGYQMEEFKTFVEAWNYCLSGELYTSDFFIAKPIALEAKEIVD